MTPRTLFGVASMTKSFTAVAVLRLQEHGLLRVHDPVTRHLPDFRTPDPRWTKRIELHHFLTHTSGLPPLPTLWYAFLRSAVTEPPFRLATARSSGLETHRPFVESFSQLIAFLRTARYRPVGPVGERFSYSNDGYALLGAVVERVSGRSYESFLYDELLRPGDLRSTTFDPGRLFQSDDRTTLYSPNFLKETTRPRPAASEEWWETTCFRAAGGLRSNAEDILRYLDLFRTEGHIGGERILSRESVRAMTKVYSHPFPGNGYGYGLVVSGSSPRTRLITHDGGLKGVASSMGVLPAKGVTAVALANQDAAPAEQLVTAAANDALGRPLDTPFWEPPLSPTRPPLSDFAGWYGSGEGWWARVTPRSGGLRLNFTGIEVTHSNLRLRPFSGDVFRVRVRGPAQYAGFIRDATGRVEGMQVGFRIVRRRSPRERRLARRARVVW